jgi:hypothetical protein
MISTPHILTIILMLLMISMLDMIEKKCTSNLKFSEDYSDCCRDGAKSEGCRIVPGIAGGNKVFNFLRLLMNSLQELLSVFAGWGANETFPFSLEMSVKYR